MRARVGDRDPVGNALAALLATLPDSALLPVAWLRARLEAPAAGATEPIGDLSCAAVAKALGRQAGTVRGWCARGEIPGAYRLNGREWRVPQASLRTYLERQGARRGPAETDGPTDLGSWRRSARS